MINGEMLPHILRSLDLQQKFAEIIPLMEAVIVYRCIPRNKRDLVNFIQQHPIFEQPIVAAVGDGSNDISMLLQANISFGIDAPETKIPSSISDFSITKF